MDWDAYIESLWDTFAQDGGLVRDPETGEWKRPSDD